MTWESCFLKLRVGTFRVIAFKGFKSHYTLYFPY